jgi:hypothetical protein
MNQTQIKILKIPAVGYFYLINPSKRYHVYKNPTNDYALNTLNIMELPDTKLCTFDHIVQRAQMIHEIMQ